MPPPPKFQQVTLTKGVAETGESMTLAVLLNRSVLHTSRDGTLRLTDAAGTTKTAGKLDVYSHDEEGLQGVGVDPAFTTNRFVYRHPPHRQREEGPRRPREPRPVLPPSETKLSSAGQLSWFTRNVTLLQQCEPAPETMPVVARTEG